mgnify:CR=1 FL=1
MSKEWTTRRGRLLTLINRTAGLPTGSDIYGYMRCVFIFTFYIIINPNSTDKLKLKQTFYQLHSDTVGTADKFFSNNTKCHTNATYCSHINSY